MPSFVWAESGPCSYALRRWGNPPFDGQLNAVVCAWLVWLALVVLHCICLRVRWPLGRTLLGHDAVPVVLGTGGWLHLLAPGDWNWIVPGRFLAFAGPTASAKQDPDGCGGRSSMCMHS